MSRYAMFPECGHRMHRFIAFLSKPGDKFSAEITKTGNRVVKIDTEVTKRSAVKYPYTGTVVETIVHKKKD